MIIEGWYWAVAGMVLIMLELVVPSFFILWFGLGALLVAAVMALFELSITMQIVLWSISSICMVTLWFRYFKRDRHKTLIGTSAGDVIGEAGLLTRAVAPFEMGVVRFQRPILGADQWPCMAQESLQAGDRVVIISVKGNYLNVRKA